MSEPHTRDSDTLTDTFVDLLQRQVPPEASMTIPPPCFVDMQGEVLEMDAREGRLVVRFPTQERFQNPVGLMQGGMIAAALDNVFGPLSYFVGRTALTSRLDVRFLRPVTESVDAIVVEGRVSEETDRHLFMRGTVRDDDGTVCAVGHAEFRPSRRAQSSR